MGFQEKICGVASEISFHVEIFILLKVSCDVRRLKVSFSMQGGVLFNGVWGILRIDGFYVPPGDLSSPGGLLLVTRCLLDIFQSFWAR